jgi:hypothetical protein
MNTSDALTKLTEFGLAVVREGDGLRGAPLKDGPYFQGPLFVIEKEDGWRVRLTGHLLKWGRVYTFSNLDDAVALVKEVYSHLMDFQTDGWKPRQTT